MIEFMIDSANMEAISRLVDTYPIAGVTSNPSILKNEGKIDFFAHMRKIRKIIGSDRSLHIQVVASDKEGILKDAEAVLRKVDERVYIKIPVTAEGFKAMKYLRSSGVNITATAVYTQFQALMALAAGADYVALYYNRMEDMDVNAKNTVSSLRSVIDRDKLPTKILAASFKNIRQTTDAMTAGSHGITATPAVVDGAFSLSALQNAVDSFRADWAGLHGDITIAEL